MGGRNSGNHDHSLWRAPKKEVVEDCQCLDLIWLARQGAFTPRQMGRVEWIYRDPDTLEKRKTASIDYRTQSAAGAGLILTLLYRKWGEDVTLPICLETAPLPSGGRRWWGRCPLLTEDGRLCSKRLGTLYLPPGAHYFGCRRCYHLTYTSCRENHKWDRVCQRIARDEGEDFAALKRVMDRGGRETRRQWLPRPRHTALGMSIGRDDFLGLLKKLEEGTKDPPDRQGRDSVGPP
jgi:hypothetical protein